MPTSICTGARQATFSATNNTSTKQFVSSNTPLTQHDHPYLSKLGSTTFGGSNQALGGQSVPLVSGDSNPDLYRVEVLASYNGAVIYQIGGVTIASTAGTSEFAPSDPVDMPVIGAGQTLSAIGQVYNPPGFRSNFTYRVCRYSQRYGHRVVDSAGQVEIFRSESLTLPAPFTSSCADQCPPGQIRCNGCCIACAPISAQLKAIEARL
jgi:hypothetical protein